MPEKEKKNIIKRKKINPKKNKTTSLKKQAERHQLPTPKSVEEWRGHRGLIEYQMPVEMAKDLLDSRKGKEKGMDPQKWLCDYINDTYHFIGYCVKVIIA